jgi:Bacterial Ig domain
LENKGYKTLILILLVVITPMSISQFVPSKTLTPIFGSPVSSGDSSRPISPTEPTPGPGPSPGPEPVPDPSQACGRGIQSSFPCIFLRSHSVLGTRWEHSWIVYRDEGGVEKYYRGGMDLDGSSTCQWGVEAEYGDYKPGTADWDPSARSILLISGPEARGKDGLFKALADRINSVCVPYFVSGPNSNTAAYYMLSQAGLRKQAGIVFSSSFCNCPGWNNPELVDYIGSAGTTTPPTNNVPSACQSIVQDIERLKTKLKSLQERLQSAPTNQKPDLVDLITELNSQIEQKENELRQCIEMNSTGTTTNATSTTTTPSSNTTGTTSSVPANVMEQQQQQPPQALGREVETTLNTPVDITLQASDANPNDELNATIVSSPSNGQLSEINQDTGTVSYTPNPGFIGQDSFTFKVNDGKADSINTATVSIIVNSGGSGTGAPAVVEEPPAESGAGNGSGGVFTEPQTSFNESATTEQEPPLQPDENATAGPTIEGEEGGFEGEQQLDMNVTDDDDEE